MTLGLLRNFIFFVSHMLFNLSGSFDDALDCLCRQEITQGVRSSTRAVRVAEEKLRHMTNMSPSGFPVVCDLFLGKLANLVLVQ